MSTCVWITVQDDVGALAAPGDQILRAVRFGLGAAEDTAVFFSVVFDVFHTPGRPDAIHGVLTRL